VQKAPVNCSLTLIIPRMARFLTLILASFGLIYASGQSHIAKTDSETGTLILIAATKNQITLAADSGSTSHYEGIQPGHTKIFPVGRYSACAIFRNAAITLRLEDKVLNRVDFGDEVTKWIAAHPHAEVVEAAPAIADAMRSALTTFVEQNSRYMLSLTSDTSLICVGFSEAKPIAILNTISLTDPAKPIGVKHSNFQLPPGFLVGLGLPDVTTDVLQGNDQRLAKYRSKAPVQKYRIAVANKALGTLTAADLIMVSRVCLAATESAEGHVVDPDSVIVVPPNHFAVISRFSGLRNLPNSD